MAELSPTFDATYAKVGRPSIPPERLLKASILIALYSVRSERQFCERLQYDLLFKWFLDMNGEDPAFDATTFSKNWERLLENDVTKLFFAAVLEQARLKHYISSDHLVVRAAPPPVCAGTHPKQIRHRDGVAHRQRGLCAARVPSWTA
jgi:hypothetical protein